MSTPDDIDALAGEFVLGTLDRAERAAVTARRQREPVLDAAIRDWERRLSPLDAGTLAVPPPADLFARIESRIANAALPAPAALGPTVIEFASLQRRVTRWRRAAVAASAVAASLLVVVGMREAVYRETAQLQYVGVFAKDDVLPAFYLTIDLKSRMLTLRPVDARPEAGKTYQLWIASDQLGPAPQSLGLVDAGLAPTTKELTRFDVNLLQRATFGVSLEPAGGSPTGRPSNPALHTKLLPVAR